MADIRGDEIPEAVGALAHVWGQDGDGNAPVRTPLADFAASIAPVDRLRVYDTVAELPPAGTLGRVAAVRDATAPTHLGALTGGGTVKCPVFDNGTIWVSF